MRAVVREDDGVVLARAVAGGAYDEPAILEVRYRT
jgi:hypothetical protein